jgi:hypothetical protein
MGFMFPFCRVTTQVAVKIRQLEIFRVLFVGQFVPTGRPKWLRKEPVPRLPLRPERE